MLPDALDTSPLPAPSVRFRPEGRPISYDALVRTAGMRNVVTLSNPPDVRIHAGTTDFKVPRPGAPAYCIAGSTLPAAPRERAREVLRRLAYEFGEYASREIVARYHRDLKSAVHAARSDDQVRTAKRLLSPAAMKIRRALREVSEANISDLAEATGMAQPNVSRAISDLVRNGVVKRRKTGRVVVCSLASSADPDFAVDAALTILKSAASETGDELEEIRDQSPVKGR
jgi:DNA-binding transcriptional ArsR family regulator